MGWSWAELRAASVLAEDDAVLALHKPAGIAVTGERHDVDLVELAEAAGERLYPVHRIDKATSGLVLFAKDLAAHGGLTRQFAKREADKAYLAVTRSTGLPDEGVIELPLSAGRKGRVRIAAPRERIRHDDGRWWVSEADLLDTKRYPSTTLIRSLWTDGEHTVLVAVPVTGRRHQIRVHLAWIGHPIAGDPLFGGAAEPRTYLHSWRLGLAAPWLDPPRLELAAVPDDGFWAPLRDPRPDVAELLANAARPRSTSPGRPG
ncbi:RluA family pseudouridine synthase [Actinophytocola gossypii]|uniref:RNA pseudouridylate synthase n=1 Tax=Actinophytocola gossypii TaxID=2812003 RepID=A0ABT2J962_9PSEU|nr:RNA pseudouridine synthase [Actinophytocola gossypii]MCT2584326.1 RNA pseudouridine synthase [Actinophytocola gossypii]